MAEKEFVIPGFNVPGDPYAKTTNPENFWGGLDAGEDALLQKMYLDSAPALEVPLAPGLVRTEGVEPQNWQKRLDSTLQNYNRISERLPFPTANPLLMKQRETLQKRADGYSYLQSQAPRPIRWEDNFTNAQLTDAWKVQKDQFIGDAFLSAGPKNIAQTTALGKALGLGLTDQRSLLALYRDSRTDWVYKKNALDFQTAFESGEAESMIAPIIRELQLENANSINDKGQPTYNEMPPLMSLGTIRDRFIDYATTYGVPALQDPEIIKKATEMYTMSTPGIQYDTWYSPDGTKQLSIDKRDVRQQQEVLAKKWSMKDPGARAGDGQLGVQSLALPTSIMVADEFGGKDKPAYKAYMAARKYFGLPENFQVGSVRELTISNSVDLKHIQALKNAGALNYKPTGSVQEAQFVGPGGFTYNFVSSNPVANRYYRGLAAKIGGQVTQDEGERLARVQRGELAERDVVKVQDRQAKARDLHRLAITMQEWWKKDPNIFGVSGGIMKKIQTAAGVGLDIWNAFSTATGIGKPATSVYQADTQSIAITNIIADLEADTTLSAGEKEDSIALWIEHRDKIDAASQVLKGVGSFTSVLTGSDRASAQLAQIQIYELGMATQLARLWSTKDRLLKDIYTRATAASSMFTGSSEQVGNRIEIIIKVATQKMQDYEKQLNPGLVRQQFTVGQYGHVIPFTDKELDAKLKEKYNL